MGFLFWGWTQHSHSPHFKEINIQCNFDVIQTWYSTWQSFHKSPSFRWFRFSITWAQILLFDFDCLDDCLQLMHKRKSVIWFDIFITVYNLQRRRRGEAVDQSKPDKDRLHPEQIHTNTNIVSNPLTYRIFSSRNPSECFLFLLLFKNCTGKISVNFIK